jgi:hypothetical protein
VIAAEIAIATIIRIMCAGEAIVIRARRGIPNLVFHHAHPGEVVQDRQLRVDNLMLPKNRMPG